MFIETLCAADKKFGYGSWRLHACVSHHVDDGVVLFVADACYHRNWELRDMKGKFIIVETAEIGSGAAAPDNCHRIKKLFILKNPIQCRNN